MDVESPIPQKGGWQRLEQAATAAEEMKPTGQLANPSERLSNPLTSPQRPRNGGCRREPTGISRFFKVLVYLSHTQSYRV